MVSTGRTITEYGITRHDIGRFVTENQHNMTHLETAYVDDIYDGCETTKNCFGLPDFCVATQSCDFVATFHALNGRMQFEMKSLPSRKYFNCGLIA